MQVKEKLVALAYIFGWMTASSGLILLNKYILSTLNFHYPLTLCRCGAGAAGARRRGALTVALPRPVSLGLGFSFCASATLIHVAKTHKLEQRRTRDFYMKRICPLGFLMARRPGAARRSPWGQRPAWPL